jgi:hypothetical protein
VLTDGDGWQQFGFCWYFETPKPIAGAAPGSRLCLCMLSYLPWVAAFYHILKAVARDIAGGMVLE